MGDSIEALRLSVDRLQSIAAVLDGDQLTARAYPSEWTISQVLSHLGSAAVIFRGRIEAGVKGEQFDDDFAPKVWDEWNAKTPAEQAKDGLAEDRSLLDYVTDLPVEDRVRVKSSMGPMTVHFDELVLMRLSEHVLHTWDIEVALDPAASLPAELVAEIIDGTARLARYTARPTGAERVIRIVTTDPARSSTISLFPDRVEYELSDSSDGEADLTMPAEAFVRLVYGRLDPDHTPALEGPAEVLDELRKVFPGF
jgi:uncharacterized protein (TIGR03083 family)